MQSWGQKYVTLKSTGTPAAGASTFAFTSPAMNSPLFSPLRAAELTVNLTTGSGSGCPDYAPTPGGDVVAFLTTGGLSSNIATETDKTLDLLEVAAEDDGVVLDIVGNNLVAMNLSPGQVSGSTGTAQWAGASTTTINWIASLNTACASWANGQVTSDDATRRLLGTARVVDNMEEFVKDWGRANAIRIETYQVEARFGSFGALPIVIAYYFSGDDQGFLMIDGVNGALNGPFAPGTFINPAALLATHPDAYLPGTPMQIVNAANGKCAARADVVTPFPTTPPPGTVPPGLVPVPGRVLTPTLPALPTGRPTPWTCTLTGGTCTCKVTYNYEPGPGVACPITTPLASCLVKVTVTCTGPAGGAGCNGGPAGPAPAPPAAPGGPVPGTGAPGLGSPGWGTCSESWWYWA